MMWRGKIFSSFYRCDFVCFLHDIAGLSFDFRSSSYYFDVVLMMMVMMVTTMMMMMMMMVLL